MTEMTSFSLFERGRMSPPRKGYRFCSHCKKNRADRFFSSSRARFCSTCLKKKRSKGAHEQHVMKEYGLGPGEWDLLWEAQGKVCAICGKTPHGRPDTDHDHSTGLLRGLLCRFPLSHLRCTSVRETSPSRLTSADGTAEPSREPSSRARWLIQPRGVRGTPAMNRLDR
jgi:hypothetical protein